MIRTIYLAVRILCVFFCCVLVSSAEATQVMLAKNGKATFPIIISRVASETTRANAAVLAGYLKKITGADFAIESGDGSRGIVLGAVAEFPSLPKRFEAHPGNPLQTEEYLLYSHSGGLLLVGSTDLGAQNALWDFLGRQGYRQYFPGPAWEIVPSIPRMTADYDDFQKPDYAMRAIWYSGGTYPERLEAFKDWQRKNRMQSGFYINAGHSYGTIINRNLEAFKAHPEFVAMVKGERVVKPGSKLNAANPDLRELVVNTKLDELRKNPQQTSVSMDPSDGGGWDESEEAKAIGSPSNQAITLANAVAEAVQKEFPGRSVGLYAYNEHAEPPTIKIHPNVFAFVTTAFRGTLLSLHDQMDGWAKQGATVGIRDYLSYAAANYDIPSRCNGFKYRDFAKRFKSYHDYGARFYSGEASDNWGINGFLYYTSARVLWNVNDTGFMDGLQDEFLANCFGPVAEEIRPYYKALERGTPLEEQLVKRLFIAINAAREKTPDAAIVERLDDLALYARYLELYNQYSKLDGAKRGQAARDLFTHLYRIRLRSVAQSRATMRDLPGRDKSLASLWTENERKRLRAGLPTWAESAQPYTHQEIDELIASGLKNNDSLDFEPVSFSTDLVPASGLEREGDLKPGALGINRKRALYYTYAKAPGSTWKITITNGGITPLNASTEFWAAEEALPEALEIKATRVEPGQSAEIILSSKHAGLHWLFLSGLRNGKNGSDVVEFDSGKPWTISTSTEAPALTLSFTAIAPDKNRLYFYVPKGTKVIGAHALGRGELVDPNGKVVKKFDNTGYVKIEVSEDLGGRLWHLRHWRGGNFDLLTVPPYLASSAKDLLLPKEVVEADALGLSNK